MVSQRVLDAGLVLLAVATLGAAGAVLLRDPAPPSGSLSAPPAAPASPAAVPSAAVLPSAPATTLDALLLRSPTTPAGHVVQAGGALGWRLSDAPLDADPARLAGQEVVLVQAGQTDADDVLAALPQVREAAPSARLVVVGPLVPVSGGMGPAALAEAGQAVGAEVLDPAALGWLQDLPDAFAPGGGFTPEGAQRVGERLAESLDG